MKRILIECQQDIVNLTIFADLISVGRRNEKFLIGDKLNELLENKKMDLEQLIKDLGNSYRDNLIRISNNEEIPNKKMIDKIINYFNLPEDYFRDSELNNVIITDGNIVVGKYATDERTLEVYQELNKKIKENFLAGKPIVLEMPKA